MGAMRTSAALRVAQERGYDLVEVGSSSRPPVCKLLDFGKYKYEQEKSRQKNKVKSRAGELKEVQLGVKTDQHDLDTKADRAKQFFSKGYKVRLVVRMIGRENIYAERALSQIEKFRQVLEAEYEQRPVRMGTRFSTILVKADKSKPKE